MTTDSLPPPAALLDHVRSRTVPALITELTRVNAPGSARVVLARALRADLPQITARPELAAQLLCRRLAWHGVAGPEVAAPLPPVVVALRAWLDDVVREAKPGVFLRSLRPCAPTLDSAFVQEFVADFERYLLHLAFVGDGSVIAAAGLDRAAAWSCVTGARLDSFVMPEPHKWSIDIQRPQHQPANPDTFVVERPSGAVRLVVPSLDFGCWTRVRALPSLDGAIVAGWHDDYLGIIARFDRHLDASRERWRHEYEGPIDAIALSADGALLAMQTRARVLLLDPNDGAELGALETAANGLAFSFDNELLATASECAIRLWDVRAIRRGGVKSPRVSPTRVGRVDAQFDRESRRVLMGGALRDARTGATIAELPLDGGHYLEGGPPERAAGIFGDRVVEVGFHGRAFSLVDGAPLPTAKLGPFAHWHHVRVAPDGRSLAWARRGDLTRWPLCSIETGEVLREFVSSEHPAASFEFSPDGRTLASAHADGAIRLWELRGDSPPRVIAVGGSLQEFCWSIDSARIVVAVQNEGLAQVDVARGEVVARCPFAMPGPFDEHEAPRADATGWRWRATDAAVEALHGWSGFRAREHRWSIARDVGGWQLVDDRSGARACITSQTRPVVDRTGRFVATREELYAIEVDEGSVDARVRRSAQ
jgi:hypothetical protein